jgi:hypothetical protein
MVGQAGRVGRVRRLDRTEGRDQGGGWNAGGTRPYRPTSPGVYKCYIATTLENKGQSEDRNCYINCYKLQHQLLHDGAGAKSKQATKRQFRTSVFVGRVEFDKDSD